MSVALRCVLCLLVVTFCITADDMPSLTDEDLDEIDEDYSEYRANSRIKSVEGSLRNQQHRGPSSRRRAARLREHVSIILGATVNWNKLPNETNLIDGDIQPLPGFGTNGRPVKEDDEHGSEERRKKRKAVNPELDVVGYWPNGELFWRIDPNKFKSEETVRTRLRRAMQPLEDKSCVKFTEILNSQAWPSEESLVLITNTKGQCSSTVGRVPGEWQRTSLAPPCQTTGTIQHELLHALGFGHEHERPDRDKIVAVNVEYVGTPFVSNFAKEPAPTYTTDIPYDLTSIMHYSLNEFNIPSGGNTLEVKNSHLAINALDVGQRDGFTWMDEVAVNQIYNCKKNCTLDCQNGGYIRKDGNTCKCICPEGLGGNRCERVQGCGGVIDIPVGQTGTVFSHLTWNGVNRYRAGTKCYWLLRTSRGAILNIEFESFNVVCNHNVQIRNYHIAQPSAGLCGSTEPAAVDTRPSPTGNMMMVVMDTKTGRTTGSGFKAVVTAIKDGCLGDPCHGAPCEPMPGSTTEHKCIYPDYDMHCNFKQGVLRNCDRVHYNDFYQSPDDYQLAFYTTKTDTEGAYAFAVTDFAPTFIQRGIMSISPHAFAGSRWCFHFKFKQILDDELSLKIYLVRNGQLNTEIFTSISAAVKPSYEDNNINIDGRRFSVTDMYEIVFEVTIQDVQRREDEIQFDDFHLIRGQCPTRSCSTFPCRDAECFEENRRAVCRYPEDDIHCDFESSENRCAGKVEFVGTLSTADSADWTINSGPTITDNTGPSSAYSGVNYLYVESNFPPDLEGRTQREAYLRLSPRRAGRWCLSFFYHMKGEMVTDLQARLLIERFSEIGSDSSSTVSFQNIKTISDQQGDQWQRFIQDVDTTSFNDDVKIQVEIIAKGRAKYSDIAIDDLHYVKGTCDSIAPVDGTWSNWSDYGSCSETCGQGIQSRTRVCTGRANNGRDCVGSSSETRECNDGECQIAVNGRLTEWTEWTACSVTCGTGSRSRRRSCISPQNGGNPCPNKPLTESQNCVTTECPVNGRLTEWTEWTACSVTCGTGSRSRRRSCISPQNGGNPCPNKPLTESQNCFTTECPGRQPIDGRWSSWSRYSRCTRDFQNNDFPNYGGREEDDDDDDDDQLSRCRGVRYRTRTCTNPAPRNGGRQCLGRDERLRACDLCR